LPTSKPDWPPSPYIVASQAGDVVFPSHVPLSCVPPIRFVLSNGFTATLWNCRVESPWFSVVSFVGTAERSSLHVVVYGPKSGLQFDVASVSCPLERITPPSEPSKKRSGFAGSTPSACWSGWIPVVGEALSRVWSVQVFPASCDSSTARPLLIDRPNRL